MSDCQLTDTWGYHTGASAGAITGIQGATIIGVPDMNTRRFTDSGGAYRPTAPNPNITTAAYQQGIPVTTDSNGQWTMYLPQTSSSKPTSPTPQWSLIFPDGKILTGAVPNVAGPLTVDDLITTYSWTWASSIYVAPVTPGTLVRGSATFTAATSATITFSTAFASSAYQIFLTASVDSVTGNIPVPGWSSKSASGFNIVLPGTFTGTVDYEAVLG